jgi:hypothetical protein
LLTTNGSTASWSNAVTVSGSNATVGGTLTVSGTGSSTVAGTLVVNPIYAATQKLEVQIPHTVSTENYLRVASNTSGNIYGAEYGYGLTSIGDPEIRINRVHAATSTNVIKIPTSTGNVIIGTTTASTTTSTGALVVGNGTSGGLGVGGAIWGGGKVHVGSAGYADGGAKLNVYATPSDAGYLYGIRLSDNSTATLALGLQTPTGTTSSFIHSNIALGFGTVGVAALNINTSQQVQVLATTASSSTTTGALVVSGGVGVAGAIYAGGDVVSTGSGAQEIVCESTTAGNYAGVISKNNSGNTFNLYSLGSTYGGTVFGGVSGNNQAVLEGSASISSICISHANPTGKIIIAPNRTNVLMVENSLVTVASGVDLKLGNAYAAGAPTATGYIVIKDSTGTSYKIPAVAL